MGATLCVSCNQEYGRDELVDCADGGYQCLDCIDKQGKDGRYKAFCSELLAKARTILPNAIEEDLITAFKLYTVFIHSLGWKECGEFWKRLERELIEYGNKLENEEGIDEEWRCFDEKYGANGF